MKVLIYAKHSRNTTDPVAQRHRRSPACSYTFFHCKVRSTLCVPARSGKLEYTVVQKRPESKRIEPLH